MMIRFRERTPTVPDRDRPGDFRLRVCSQCHAGRLIDDIETIMRQRDARSPGTQEPA